MTNQERINSLLRAAYMLEYDVLRAGHYMSQCKRDEVSNTIDDLRDMAEELSRLWGL